MKSERRLIVYERSGRWAVSLRRAAASISRHDWELCETRSLPECLDAVRSSPDALVAIELSRRGAGDALSAIIAIGDQFPTARVAVLADRPMARHEWLARELGAVAVAASDRDLRPIVQIAQRHFRRLPAPPRSFRQRVMSELPWSSAAGINR